jgi:hypothetical protein
VHWASTIFGDFSRVVEGIFFADPNEDVSYSRVSDGILFSRQSTPKSFFEAVIMDASKAMLFLDAVLPYVEQTRQAILDFEHGLRPGDHRDFEAEHYRLAATAAHLLA